MSLLGQVDIDFRDHQATSNSSLFSPSFFDGFLRLIVALARLGRSRNVTGEHVQDAFDLLKACSDNTQAFAGGFVDFRKGGQSNTLTASHTLACSLPVPPPCSSSSLLSLLFCFCPVPQGGKCGDLRQMRSIFLQAMLSECAETGSEVQTLEKCWEIAHTRCHLPLDGAEFKIAFMEPMVDSGKIMVRKHTATTTEHAKRSEARFASTPSSHLLTLCLLRQRGGNGKYKFSRHIL